MKNVIDLKTKIKNKAMDEYWEYQAAMAGQSSTDVNEIKIKFGVYASLLEMRPEDLWSECEDTHEQVSGAMHD